MKQYLLMILFLSTIFGYSQSSNLSKPAKRTTLYKARLAISDPKQEKNHMLHIEKDLQKADVLFERGDYTQAFVLYTKYEKYLDEEQYNFLGWMYENGEGVSKNIDKAIFYCRKSAEKGNLTAIYNLGCINQYYLKNYEKAIYWYEKAAELGNFSSMTNLGVIYLQGLNGTIDNEKAFFWFEKAAEKGNFYSMANLGYMYILGAGVPKNFDQAFYWSKKSAEGGNSYGMINLGTLYEEGIGVLQDYGQALYWYRRSAEAGNGLGMNKLAILYSEGKGTTKDHIQAF